MTITISKAQVFLILWIFLVHDIFLSEPLGGCLRLSNIKYSNVCIWRVDLVDIWVVVVVCVCSS
jgi:hypothetical protein